MATVNKDFRVKHGIIVADGGTFGSTVTVATPTQNAHAATKLYVDTAVGSPTIGTTQPETPANGNLWFDTVTERIHVYYNGQWIAIATLEDSETLPDHIHDTAIDGTGLVVRVCVPVNVTTVESISRVFPVLSNPVPATICPKPVN